VQFTVAALFFRQRNVSEMDTYVSSIDDREERGILSFLFVIIEPLKVSVQMKRRKVYWVNFDQNINKASLTKKTRPAFVMAAHNDKGVFIVPLTSVEKRYHEKNKFAVKLSTSGYALCDQFEKVAHTDRRIKNEANIDLTEEDVVNIMLTLENYTALSINKKLPIYESVSGSRDLTIGDTVVFNEEIKSQVREITGIIAAIDNSMSTIKDEDYLLLHVQRVSGKSERFIYKNRTRLIRTRSTIMKGLVVIK